MSSSEIYQSSSEPKTEQLKTFKFGSSGESYIIKTNQEELENFEYKKPKYTGKDMLDGKIPKGSLTFEELLRVSDGWNKPDTPRCRSSLSEYLNSKL